MPKYMLLLYSGDPSPQELEERDPEMPEWIELIDSLHDLGLLLGTDRLFPVEAATTVRVRNQETEPTRTSPTAYHRTRSSRTDCGACSRSYN